MSEGLISKYFSTGVLRVKLKNAEKLEKKDIGVLGMGKSDPYAVLSVGARTLKTHHIKNTINPVWDFVGDFPIEVPQVRTLMQSNSVRYWILISFVPSKLSLVGLGPLKG